MGKVKATHTWYTVLALTFIGSVTIAGIAIVCTTGYDLSQILSEERREAKIRNEVLLIEQVECYGYTRGNHTYFVPDSKPHPYCTDPDLGRKGEHTFKLIFILCLSAAMILGVTQFLGSSYVLCSCDNLRRRGHIKGWLMGSIFIFLLSLLCLLIPLSYNVSSGKAFDLPGFGSHVEKKMRQIFQIEKKEIVLENLFYYMMTGNLLLLLLSILLLTALLPCGTQPYESVY